MASRYAAIIPIALPFDVHKAAASSWHRMPPVAAPSRGGQDPCVLTLTHMLTSWQPVLPPKILLYGTKHHGDHAKSVPILRSHKQRGLRQAPLAPAGWHRRCQI